MAKSKRIGNVEDLAAIVVDLTDQIKVLVSAVDDLRCEVEWWARNAADQRWAIEYTAGANSGECGQATTDTHDGDSTERTRESPTAELPRPAAATVSLADLERTLMLAPPGAWPDDWDDDDPPEFETGRVIAVDEALWCGVLELRPAHVVGHDCCCEEGMGGPYLLAWQSDKSWFLRELTEAEATMLQKVCLAHTASCGKLVDVNEQQTQLGLW